MSRTRVLQATVAVSAVLIVVDVVLMVVTGPTAGGVLVAIALAMAIGTISLSLRSPGR